MWSYFLKDIREQFKWACLIFIVYAGAFFVHHLSYSTSMTCRTLEDLVLIPCCAGLLMGVVLALSETGGNRWALMAHRPVSLQRIFWGKSLAGIALLIASLGLPLLGDLLYERFRTPRFPLFYWSMALGALPDFVSSLALMFCALATVLRQARWFGGKIFLVSLGLCAINYSANATTFLQATLVTAILLVLSMLAAQSVFLSAGQTPHKGSLGNFAIFTGIFIAIATLLFIPWTMYNRLAPLIFPKEFEPFEYRSFTIADDGTPIVITRHYSGFQSSFSYAVLDGAELNPQQVKRLNAFNSGRTHLKNTLPIPESDIFNYRSSNAFFVQGQMATSQGLFFAYDRGRKTLIFYSLDLPKIIGTLGADGFVPWENGWAKPIPMRILTDLSSTVEAHRRNDQIFLTDGLSLYKADLIGKTLVKTFTVDPGETLTDILSQDTLLDSVPQNAEGYSDAAEDEHGAAQRNARQTSAGYILVTNRKVRWIDRQFRLQHEEIGENANLYLIFSKTAGTWFLRKEPSKSPANAELEMSVTHISSDFQTTQTRTYRLPPNPPIPAYFSLRFYVPIGHEYSAIASPMFLYGVEDLAYAFMRTGQPLVNPQLWKNIPASIWIYSLCGMTLSSLLTWTWLARRLSISGTPRVVWAGVNFV